MVNRYSRKTLVSDQSTHRNMPIEFSCRCGARFRVPDSMAGQAALCQGCQQVVVVPQSIAGPPPSPYAPQPGFAQLPDPSLRKEVEQFNRTTSSSASNPGMLRVSFTKYSYCFPFWSLGLALSLAASLALTFTVSWFFLLLVLPLIAMNWFYWYIVRMKFVAGCVNPAQVVSLDPPLVAVITNLSKGGRRRAWDYVRVLPQPLARMTGGLPQIGQRLASVALYQRSDDASPHWDTFNPTVVNCVTWNAAEVERVARSIQLGDWQELDLALRQLPQPVTAGLFKIELKPPPPEPVSRELVVHGVHELLSHSPATGCYLGAGISPPLLQTALHTFATGLSPQQVIALILPEGDASGQRGLLIATEGICWSLSETQRGAFRWSDLWGAGYALEELEILLTNGTRLRLGNAFGKQSIALEALLDGLAKRDL
jgi:hypothetical protein